MQGRAERFQIVVVPRGGRNRAFGGPRCLLLSRATCLSSLLSRQRKVDAFLLSSCGDFRDGEAVAQEIPLAEQPEDCVARGDGLPGTWQALAGGEMQEARSFAFKSREGTLRGGRHPDVFRVGLIQGSDSCCKVAVLRRGVLQLSAYVS